MGVIEMEEEVKEGRAVGGEVGVLDIHSALR